SWSEAGASLSCERLRDGRAIETLEPDDDEAPFARFGRPPRPVVIMADAWADRLHQEPHGLARHRQESLHAEHVVRLGGCRDPRGDGGGVADLGKLDHEALEIV